MNPTTSNHPAAETVSAPAIPRRRTSAGGRPAKTPPLEIVRRGQTWVLIMGTRSICLEQAALRCGYRINELCAAFGCSERRLHGAFIRDVGLSPKEWMRQERMVVARRMLSGGVPQNIVSEKLGFTSKYNFRREFLVFHSIRPAQFQKHRSIGAMNILVIFASKLATLMDAFPVGNVS